MLDLKIIYEGIHMEPDANQPQNENSVSPNPAPLPTPTHLSTNYVSPPAAPSAPSPLANKKLLYLIVAGVILFFTVGALIYATMNDKKETPSHTPSSVSQPSKNENAPQEFAAKSSSDLGQVCKGGVATNVTDYKSGPQPHPIVLFTRSKKHPDSVSELTSSISYDNRAWQPPHDAITKTQLVGCLQRTSEGTSRKCEFSSITLDYYAAKYELTVWEAKTGKKVGSKEVNGPNLTCPSYTSYEKDDPKIYAQPDPGLTEQAVREFVLR